MATRKNFTVGTKRGLNLRAEPSKDASVLKVLAYEEKVVVDHNVEVPEGWVAVKPEGYVRKEFLQ